MAIHFRSCLLLALVTALTLVPALVKFAAGEAPNDVVAFMATSRLIHDHAGVGLYRPDEIRAAQNAFGAMGNGWMPWAYPPFASLLSALYPTGRGAMPVVLILQGLAMLWLALRCARTVPDPKAFLVVSAPLIAIANLSGQPSFIVVLIAYLLVVRFSPVAGVAWLAVVKPHLAVGPAVALLREGGWRSGMLLACIVALASIGGLLAVSALAGAEPLAMFEAWREASRRMLDYVSAVGFPLPRFVSPYAMLRTLAVPHALAIAGAGVIAVAVLGMVLRAKPGQRLALGFAAALLTTPYIYDYDAGVLLVGLALASRHAGTDLINRYGIAVMFNAVSGYLCLFALPQLGISAPFNPAPVLTAWVILGLAGMLPREGRVLAEPSAAKGR